MVSVPIFLLVSPDVNVGATLDRLAVNNALLYLHIDLFFFLAAFDTVDSLPPSTRPNENDQVSNHHDCEGNEEKDQHDTCTDSLHRHEERGEVEGEGDKDEGSCYIFA